MQKLFKSSLKYVVVVAFICYANSLTADENWHWHGFLAQGLIQAKDSNFVNNDGDVSAQLTELGVNSVWQIDSDLRLSGQLMYLDGGNRYHEGWRIDYLFLNWAALNHMDWQLDVYIGRFKNLHWLYSGTRDVAFTRPMIILPQSIYFDAFRDIAVGSDGVAIQSTFNLSQGDLEFHWSLGSTPIPKEQSQRVISSFITGRTEQDFVHQISAFFQRPLSQSKWGISLLDSDFNYRRTAQDVFADGDFTIQRVMLNWRHSAERWELASEIFQERVSVAGFYFPGATLTQFGQGAYVLGRLDVTNQTRIYGSYDYFYANKDDKQGKNLPLQSNGAVPAYFGYQRDTAIGISHDVLKNLRVQMEYHWTVGTGRLGPSVIPETTINKSKNHQLWAVQLMYWF